VGAQAEVTSAVFRLAVGAPDSRRIPSRDSRRGDHLHAAEVVPSLSTVCRLLLGAGPTPLEAVAPQYVARRRRAEGWR
jgi:hypothetical protein